MFKKIINTAKFKGFWGVYLLCMVTCVYADPMKIDVKEFKLDSFFSPWVEKFKDRVAPRLYNFYQNNEADLQPIKSVMYAFGGADLLYPLSLFPNVETLILMGLEYPGEKGVLAHHVIDMVKAQEDLTTLIKKSFFITTEMSKSFTKGFGNSPTILVQLHLLGIDEVTLDFLSAPGPGVKYSFFYKGKERHVYYFKTNLMDYHFPDKIKDFIAQQAKPLASFFKAASYLVHQKKFSFLRAFVCKESQLILQDDTGIPYENLQDFDVHLWGPYQKPYGVEFLSYTQKTLQTLSNQGRSINFCFGYGCGRQAPVIMLASKKANLEAKP